MVEIAGMLGGVLTWFSSIVFWIVVTLFIIIGGFLMLLVRKKRALTFNAFELNFLKNGKLVWEHRKAGWFGKKKMFFGLIDIGKEKVMMLNDGRIVRDFSVDDYHEYRKGNKKAGRCIFVMAHPEDKQMVVPISSASVDPVSLEAVYEIAPADYREAAVSSFGESVKELRGTLDRVLPYIMIGGMLIFFIIGLIISGQLTSQAVEGASGMLADAGDTLERVAQLLSVQPSVTAP